MFLLELFLEVLSRLVGVSVLAGASWAGSGFRGYRNQWSGWFDRAAEGAIWVDLLGAALWVVTGCLITWSIVG